jgi:DNA recombination protein RmuC
MAQILALATLLASTVGLLVYLLTRRSANQKLDAVARELADTRASLLAANAEFEVRQTDLRNTIIEARDRESEAKGRVALVEGRHAALAEELKIALQEKGQFQNEATRVDELRESLLERESENLSLNARILDLEREKLAAQKDAEAASTRAMELVAIEQGASRAVITAKNEQIAKLDEFIGAAREVLSTEFRALSADALNASTAQLLGTADSLIKKQGELTAADVQLNRQQIATMLIPVAETIQRLDRHVADSNLARANAEALLNEQVNRLAGASESLTNALRKPVVRGSWGEMTLENALENAGLEGEIDFVLQHHTDGEDGRLRTDAIVNLPKGRKLIIDSKNLMESYIALAGTQDETQRAVFADLHSRSLKSHIKALSAKEYWQRYDGLDCVILFIPHDGMYHAAIQDEAELIRDACDKRVFLSNPMSLIPLLKAIRYVLDQERLNKSALDISKVGAEIYGELTRFADHMARIGNKLKSTVNAYNEAIPGLDRFIVSKSRTLKQLGSAKGAEAELPDAIELEPRPFSSRELRGSNSLLEETDAERWGSASSSST